MPLDLRRALLILSVFFFLLMVWDPLQPSELPRILHPNENAASYVLLRTPYGGLGDRLRAMVLGFYIASLTDRQLLIEDSFVGGRDYAAPNSCDWLADSASQIESKAFSFNKWTFIDPDIHRNSLTNVDFKGMAHLKVFDLYTNLIYLSELYENTQLQDHRNFQTFAELYHEGRLWNHALTSLLRPAPKLAQLIARVEADHFQAKRARTFKIGIQMRAGDDSMTSLANPQAGGSRKLSYSRYVPGQAAHCFALRAAQFWEELGPKEKAQEYPGGPVVLVSSDSSKLNDLVIARLKALDIKAITTEEYGGEIQHLDKAPKEQEQTRTFLDWFLLGSMDRLAVSISGFAETAAKYSCAPAAIFFNIPEAEGYNDFEDCQLHFHEAGPTGLCQPGFDRGMAEHFLGKMYQGKPALK